MVNKRQKSVLKIKSFEGGAFVLGSGMRDGGTVEEAGFY